MKEKNEDLKKRLSKMAKGYGPRQRIADLLQQVSDLYKKEMATVDMAEGLTFKLSSSEDSIVVRVDDEHNKLFILELLIEYCPERSVAIRTKDQVDANPSIETISIDMFSNELDDLKYFTQFLRRFEGILASPLYHRYPEKKTGRGNASLTHTWEIIKGKSSKPLNQTAVVSNDFSGLMNGFKNDLVKWIVGGAVVNALFNVILHYC